MRPIMENSSIPKTGQNIKFDALILLRHGLKVEGIRFDTMIAAHLLKPEFRSLKLDNLSLEYLNYPMVPIEDLIGSGRNQISMAEVDIEKVSFYAAEDADVALQLTHIFEKKLKKEGLYNFFSEVEIPLLSVLLEMEFNEMFIDSDLLKSMYTKIGKKINKGEIISIIGESGVGKTTLLRAIAALIDFDVDDDYEEHYEKYQNEILFNGESIFDWDPHEVVELGLSLVPEGRSLFGELTVIENLKLGAYPLRAQKTLSQNLEKVLSIFPKLADRRNQTTRFMSGGEQQMLAIGRALMARPRILLLDEPSLGLAPMVVTEIFLSLIHI